VLFILARGPHPIGAALSCQLRRRLRTSQLGRASHTETPGFGRSSRAVSPTLSLIVVAHAKCSPPPIVHDEYLSGDFDGLHHRSQQQHLYEYIKPYSTGLELSRNVSDRRLSNERIATYSVFPDLLSGTR
jgi:hypothetical protein